MMTLLDASADVGDERQPAAQVPCPARQHPVSSWEAVRELVYRHPRHLRAAHHRGDGIRKPGHPSPSRPAPSTPAPQLGHRWASAARAPRAEEVAAGWLSAARAVLPRDFVTFPWISASRAAGLAGCAGPGRPLRAAAGRARRLRGRCEAGPTLREGWGSSAVPPQEPWVKRLRAHTVPPPCPALAAWSPLSCLLGTARPALRSRARPA